MDLKDNWLTTFRRSFPVLCSQMNHMLSIYMVKCSKTQKLAHLCGWRDRLERPFGLLPWNVDWIIESHLSWLTLPIKLIIYNICVEVTCSKHEFSLTLRWDSITSAVCSAIFSVVRGETTWGKAFDFSFNSESCGPFMNHSLSHKSQAWLFFLPEQRWHQLFLLLAQTWLSGWAGGD